MGLEGYGIVWLLFGFYSVYRATKEETPRGATLLLSYGMFGIVVSIIAFMGFGWIIGAVGILLSVVNLAMSIYFYHIGETVLSFKSLALALLVGVVTGVYISNT